MDRILHSPSFMTQRERLLTDYCTFKLRQHALNHGARVLLNPHEIDEYGYDLNIEEDFSYVPAQLKTKFIHSQTKTWQILASFFTPSLHDQKDFDLKVDQLWVGLHGGGGVVFLQEFTEETLTDIERGVSYLYCDFLYVLLVARGYWISKNFSREDALNLLRKLQQTAADEKFHLPLRAFVPVIAPSVILDWRFHTARPTNYNSIFLFPEGKMPDNHVILELYRKELSLGIPTAYTSDFPSYRE